ncbi:MAG: hypothetical protein GF308_03795 [Candidatus Heimdallarchaeota archaeon]|nr:hypothetical protein [Candidatus Heimdallarchaeota archaeon]
MLKLSIYGVIFSKFDSRLGPIISNIYPSDFSKKLSNQQLAKIAVQSLALYETDRESFNIFIIKGELIGVAYVIKLLGDEFERGMLMFSLVLIISDLNPLVLKMILKNSVKQLYSTFRKTDSFGKIKTIMEDLYINSLKISNKAAEKYEIILDKSLIQKIQTSYPNLVAIFSTNPMETLQELEKEESITRFLAYHIGYLAGTKMWLEKNKALLEIGAKMTFDFSAILKQDLISACSIFGDVRKGSSQSVSIYNNKLVNHGYPCSVIVGYISGIIRKILDYSENPDQEFVLKEVICSEEGFEYCDFFVSLYKK